MSSINIHDAFLPLYIRQLKNTSHILNLGLAHTASRNIPESEILAWRLAPDMNSLLFQIHNICTIARNLIIIVAGNPLPPSSDNDTGLAQLEEKIAATIKLLEGMTREQFEGRDEEMVEVKALGTRMKGLQYVHGFGLPNFYFHNSIIYALFRSHGVPIGKRDFLSGGL